MKYTKAVSRDPFVPGKNDRRNSEKSFQKSHNAYRYVGLQND